MPESLVADIQKSANENNVLQKYSDFGGLNILTQIWISIVGIYLNFNKEGEKGSIISLIADFCISNNDNDNKDINIITNIKEVSKEKNVMNLIIISKIINAS